MLSLKPNEQQTLSTFNDVRNPNHHTTYPTNPTTISTGDIITSINNSVMSNNNIHCMV